MPQAVVPRLAARGLEAQFAERQGEVIAHHQHALHGNFLLVHPVAHGVARQVHIRRRFQKDKRLVLHFQGRDEPIALVLKNNIGRPGEGVQYTESDIVTGAGIFVADIAQPHNQEIHFSFSE